MSSALTSTSPLPEPRDPLLEAILKRDRSVTLAGLIVISALSWGYMFYDARQMNTSASCCLALANPQMNPWPIADLVMMFVMWTVMMVAMMVPSVGPMVLVFAALNRKRRAEDRPYVPTGLFLLGYLAVWTGFSAIITLAQWGLHRAALLSPQMVSTSPIFGGGLLIFAGIFQFTSFKCACLKHCRTPLQFLMTSWRDGWGGAWKMGLEHGLQCTGCCWMLMLLLFVAGVMNLLWVATITLFVLVEKVVPRSRWFTRAGGVASIAWGVGLIIRR